MSKVKIDEEQIQEFMDMLTGGDLPDGITMPNQPQLSADSAFSVIWYLQEHLKVLPENFEKCEHCDGVFDSDCGGHIVDDGYADDPWYEEMGIPTGLVETHRGASFCSEMCEVAFFRNL